MKIALRLKNSWLTKTIINSKYAECAMLILLLAAIYLCGYKKLLTTVGQLVACGI